MSSGTDVNLLFRTFRMCARAQSQCALFFNRIHYTNIVSSKQLHFLPVKRGFPIISFVSPYSDTLLSVTLSTGRITDASSFTRRTHRLRSTICTLVLCVRIHVCIELINTEVLSTFCFPTTSSSDSLLKMFVLFFFVFVSFRFFFFFTYKLTDKNHQPVRCSCLTIMCLPNKYVFLKQKNTNY